MRNSLITLAGLLLCALARAEPSPCVVAVDAGHSDARPGATSARGRTERSFNVRLAAELAAALRARGVTVREVPSAESLEERSAAAVGAGLLVSVHHDSVQPKYLEPWTFDGRSHQRTRFARGWASFVSKKNGAFDRSLAFARAIGERLVSKGIAHSTHHAEPIPGESRVWLDEALGVMAFDDLRILKSAPVPALLVEAAVITHDDDELAADSSGHRAALVQAVVEGVRAGCAK
jgi:N-acetylmuramoyl-L-alanine amidase